VQQASGTFSVDITPRPADPDTDPLGQLRIAKAWAGQLEGLGHGVMVSGGDPTTGSAGYVAMEVVEGSLEGRPGSFALMQMGVLDAGEHDLVYRVVPGSGTGELAGITGTLDLEIVEGTHRYRLDYDLPPGLS
jgi:hypothetical protein